MFSVADIYPSDSRKKKTLPQRAGEIFNQSQTVVASHFYTDAGFLTKNIYIEKDKVQMRQR